MLPVHPINLFGVYLFLGAFMSVACWVTAIRKRRKEGKPFWGVGFAGWVTGGIVMSIYITVGWLPMMIFGFAEAIFPDPGKSASEGEEGV